MDNKNKPMNYTKIDLETKQPKSNKFLSISLWVLVLGAVVFSIWGSCRVVENSITDKFKTQIENLNNQVPAEQKKADNQKVDYEVKIKEISDKMATESASAKQSVLLDMKAYVDSKLNPQTAQAEPVKK